MLREIYTPIRFLRHSLVYISKCDLEEIATGTTEIE